MNVKSWNFFYNNEESVKEKILNTISLWGAIGLLWYAFYSIAEEHFPAFFHVQEAVSQGEIYSGGMSWQMLVLWIGILWLSYDFPEKYLKRGSLFLQGIALAIPLAYALLYYEKIISGMIALVEIYLPYVNRYYETTYLIQGGAKACMPVAVSFVVMVLWLFCWLAAYGCKKKILLAVFPAFALILELAVGLSPKGEGVFLWFMAGFLLLSMGGAAVFPKLVLLAGMAASILGAGLLFEEQIGHLASKEQKQVVLDWQEDLKNRNPLKKFLPDFYQNRQILKNEEPEYTGEVVLEITADGSPNDMIYLRGFYGSEYRDGEWNCKTSAFSDACKEAGAAQDEAAQRLFQLTYEQADAYYTKQFTYAAKTEYTIQYLGRMGDVAYMPYASDYKSLDEAYVFLGEDLLKKPFWDDTVEVEAVVPELLESHVLLSMSDAIDDGNLEEQSAIDWYNTFALEYLHVPEGMAGISEAAEKLQGRWNRVDVTYEDVRENKWMPDAFSDGLLSSIYNENIGESVAQKNGFRLEAASVVAAYLGKQMSYSLLLDDIPEGIDPVEYALTQSHEGYCMHFASAGTLLLRQLGVPARYVSGYVVTPNMFRPSDGGFVAEVTDYAAHAWVEIYLDDIGWIPVEVTPGYGSGIESLPTQEPVQETEQESESRGDETQAVTHTTEEPVESELQLSQESEQTEIEMPTEKTPSTEFEDDNSGMGDDADSNTSNLEARLAFLWKIVAGLAAIGGILCVSIKGFRLWKKHYDALLEEEIKKKRTHKAVKRMNRRIYVQLRLTHPNREFWMGKFSDTAYEQALMLAFTDVSMEDWHKYMEIVKKMHYSVENISIEEMMHCYRCYKCAGGFNSFCNYEGTE